METTTSICVRDGKRQITAGSFTETAEKLVGYNTIDVEHLNEAIAIASRILPNKKGTVEIRPIFDLSELPIVPWSKS